MRRNAISSPWTDELVERLRKLWANGYSCSQIAADLGGGITRNAIIGKVHRLSLPSRDRDVCNGNGATRFVDPTPLGTPRASPVYRRVGISRVRATVFKSIERKPDRVTPKGDFGMQLIYSNITGNPLAKMVNKHPRQPEMSKDALRAMLAQAIQNTAAMEGQP